MSMNNDAYAAALAEIEEGRLDKGVWARSFAESGGDESRAKALYITARVESIEGSAVREDTRPPLADDAGIKATDERQAATLRPSPVSSSFLPIAIFVGVGVVGIVAAIAFPAYQDYAKRQAVAENPVRAPKPQLDLSEFKPPANPFDKFDTPAPAPASQVDWPPFNPPSTASTTACFSSALGSETTPELCKQYWTAGTSSCDSNILQELVRRGVAPHQDGWSPTGTQPTGATPQQVATQTLPPKKSVPRVSADDKSANLRANQSAPRDGGFSAEVQADLNFIAARAISDYPYLGTPDGQVVMDLIVRRRNQLIQQGVYPSIALTQAVNAYAPANAPRPVKEKNN